MIFKTSDFTPQVLYKWAAGLLLPAILFFMLPRDGSLSQPMIVFLTLTFWAVCAWAMGTLNDTAVAILLPVLYVLFCGLKPGVVYQPWFSDVAFIVTGGFIIAKIIQETGLGKRIALASVRAMGGSFTGALCGVTLGAVILAPMVPSVIGKAAIFCAVVVSLCDALDFKPKSREATAVMLATCMAIGSSKFCYLTGGADITMCMGLADKVMGGHTSWMTFAWHNFVPGMIYTLLSLGLVLVMLRPAAIDKKALRVTVQENYAALGPMSDEQKRALAVLILTVILLATDTLHKINAGFILVILAALTFLPGISLMDNERLRKVNFAPLFFIMGCMCIGSAGGALKVTDWLAGLVLPLFHDMGANMAGVCAYLVGLLANFLLTPLAATSTLTSPIAELGAQMGLDPRMLCYAFQYGLDNLIFPYEYALYLYFFSTGYIRFRSLVLVMAVRMVLAGLFIAFVAVPYWRLVMG